MGCPHSTECGAAQFVLVHGDPVLSPVETDAFKWLHDYRQRVFVGAGLEPVNVSSGASFGRPAGDIEAVPLGDQLCRRRVLTLRIHSDEPGPQDLIRVDLRQELDNLKRVTQQPLLRREERPPLLRWLR